MIIDYYFKVNKSVWQFYQNRSLIWLKLFKGEQRQLIVE